MVLRDPTLIAQQAATLDELTGGRAEIVFSIGNVAMLNQYGIAWQGTLPLARLREAHEVLRAFLAGAAPELIERHGIPTPKCGLSSMPSPAETSGAALELTTPGTGEWLSIAGTPKAWIERIRADIAPHGYNHIALP